MVLLYKCIINDVTTMLSGMSMVALCGIIFLILLLNCRRYITHPSGLTPPLGLCRCEDICGLYSALSQDGKLVVEVIPLVVWGLCFGKVGGVISFLFGPVRGYHRTGPQGLLTPPVSASSIYAAVVYVSGG